MSGVSGSDLWTAIRLVLALVWILVLAVAWLRLDGGWPPRGRLPGPARNWPGTPLLVFSVAVLVRLVPAAVLSRGAAFDIQSYGLIADLFLSGTDVYTAPEATERHPYLPFLIYWMAGARLASGGDPALFATLVKILPIVADAAICVVLYRSRIRLAGRDLAGRIAWLYALNPVTILVTAYHGQFDSIPMLFAVLASYWLQSRGAGAGRDVAISGLLLGLGVLSKSWPAMFLPLIVLSLPGIRPAMLFGLSAVAPPAIGMALYAALTGAEFAPILVAAITYGSNSGWWGYTALLNAGDAVLGATEMGRSFDRLLALAGQWGKYATLAVVATAGVLCARRKDLAGGMVTVVLAFFAVTAGFGIQYLAWIVPLALISGRTPYLRWYVILTLLLMILSYFGLHLTPALVRLASAPVAYAVLQLLSVPVWLTVVVWLGRTVLDAGFRPRAAVIETT